MDVVCLFGLTPFDRLAPDDDPSFGEVCLLPNLGHDVPLGALSTNDCRSDELCADIGFQ
jgi:hypothetical protein